MKELKYESFSDNLSDSKYELAPRQLTRFIKEKNIKKEDIVSINNDEGYFYLFYYVEV